MLDIEEFQKKRKRIFDDRNSISSLSELKEYIQDLEIVSANEKSGEIENLVRNIITEIKEDVADEDSLFKLYVILFMQIYYFERNLRDSENLLKKMKNIADETKDVEQNVIIMKSQYLLHQIKGEKEEAKEKISRSLDLIEKYKESYEKTYFETLYAYTISVLFESKKYSEAIENVEKCLKFYHESYNVLGLIKVIYLLLSLYFLNGEKDKVSKMFNWILQEEKIQEKISDTQYITLYWLLGVVASVNLQIDESIEFLTNVYERIKEEHSQKQMLYEYVEALTLLSRSYAYKGNFQKSYDFIIELLKFIKTDFCKKSYISWRLKQIYFSIHYTLLFVFVQLKTRLQDLEDEKLKTVYKYTKTLIEESQFSENLLLSSSISEERIKEITEKEHSHTDEFHLIVHQQLISLEAHKLSEETIEKLNVLRDYVHSPLYADILIGKIHLSLGNFEQFNKIVEGIMRIKDKADTPILLMWVRLFELLNEYISEEGSKNLHDEFSELEIQARKNNFHKMADEVVLYQKLISSSRTLSDSRERFKETVLYDIYDKNSQKMVLEYLET